MEECRHYILLLTVYGHPEDEERHGVELPSTADTEPEPAVAPLQLHGKVLVLLAQVDTNLVVLLHNQPIKRQSIILLVYQSSNACTAVPVIKSVSITIVLTNKLAFLLSIRYFLPVTFND